MKIFILPIFSFVFFCIIFHQSLNYHPKYILELSKLNGSKVVEGLIVTRKVKSNLVSNWRWYIKCGLCTKDFLVRVDADCQGRVNYFLRRTQVSFFLFLLLLLFFFASSSQPVLMSLQTHINNGITLKTLKIRPH